MTVARKAPAAMSFLQSSSARVRQLLRQIRSFMGRPRVVVQQKPVVVDAAEGCENPILLLGVHRSGTSLIRRMFNAHRNIACPPETFFLRHYAELIRDPDNFEGFEGMGFDREAALVELRHGARRFHEAFRRFNDKARWADKTPQYVFYAEELRELFGPDARYVVIFRHPFDVVTSIFFRNWRIGDYDADQFTNTVRYVEDAQRRQLAFLAAYPDQAMPLFYELLCQAPEATLTPVLDFLGESWDPNMLAFYSGTHNEGVEDPMVRGMKRIELSFGTWTQLSDAQFGQLERALGAHAAALGYPVDRTGAEIDGGRLAVPAPVRISAAD
jgi:hypothetical protein